MRSAIGWIAAALLVPTAIASAQDDRDPADRVDVELRPPEAAGEADGPAEDGPPQPDRTEAEEPGESAEPEPEPVPVEPEPAAPSEPPDVELSAEDLAAIEQATAADAAALEEERAPIGDDAAGVAAPLGAAAQGLEVDLSFVGDFAFAWFSDDEPDLQTGGHDPVDNGFTLQQLEMSIGAAVDPYFRFDANLVFSLFGVEIEEAYATTLDFPAKLQMRMGQFLTRFGRLNATHPHAWHFVDQPFALGRVFGGEGNRGLGVEISWLSPLPWYVELVASATDAAGEATARSFFGGQDLGVETPLDLQYTTAVKQFFALSDNWSLFWGLSAAFGPNPTGRANRSEVYGTDIYLKWRPITYQSYEEVSFQSEWLYRRRQVPEDVLSDVSGYAYVFWRFDRRWGAAVRYGYGSPAYGLEGGVVADYLDPEWTDHRHRVAANLTFWPTEFSRFRVQGAVDYPTWLEDPIYAGFLQAEFVTGAHGAHEF